MVNDYHTSRRAYLAAASTAATLAVAGCTGGNDGGDQTATSPGTDGGSPGGMATSTATPEPVSVSMATTQTGSVGALTAIIQEEGLDTKHGVSLDIQEAAPPKAMQLLRNEAVTVSIFSPQGAAVANTQGSNIRLFGPMLANHISLMTSQMDGISGWDDLVGESVGIMPPPTGMWNQALLLLAELGHTADDFDFRKGAPGAIHSFDARGDVAAHLHFIPVTIKALTAGDMREVQFMPDRFQDLFGHNLQFVPLAAHDAWLQENADAAVSLRNAAIEAQQLVKEQPQETISRFRDVIGLESDEEVQAAAERMPATYPAAWGSAQKSNVVEQLELSQEHGLIPGDAPTDIVADL